MADIFETKHAYELLKGRKIVFFGDSNVRCMYKDLIWLLNDNSLIPKSSLRTRGENSYRGDKRIGQCDLNASRDFNENRKFTSGGFSIEFFFITRCLNKQIKAYLNNVKTKALPAPDVIIMNSTIWDLTRWGPQGAHQFQDDLISLMQLLVKSLSEDTMFIWTTAFPPGKKMKKQSLLIKQVEFLEHTLRFDIMEANSYAKNVVVSCGYDLLDLHFHLRMQIHRRFADGIHFQPLPMRLITNFLLTHIALSWGFPLPNNVDNSLLNRYINMIEDRKDEFKRFLSDTFEKLNNLSDNNINENTVVSCGTSEGTNSSSKKKKRRKRKSKKGNITLQKIINKPQKGNVAQKKKYRNKSWQMRNHSKNYANRSSSRNSVSENLWLNNDHMNRNDSNQMAQLSPNPLRNISDFWKDYLYDGSMTDNFMQPLVNNSNIGQYLNPMTWDNGYFSQRY